MKTVMIIIFSCVFIIFLISRILAGLTDRFTRFIAWFGVQCPCSPQHVPYFVLLAFFFILRLLLTPYQLTHARVDRIKIQIKPVSEGWTKGTAKFSERHKFFHLLLIALDGALLFLITRTLPSESISWPNAANNLLVFSQSNL